MKRKGMARQCNIRKVKKRHEKERKGKSRHVNARKVITRKDMA